MHESYMTDTDKQNDVLSLTQRRRNCDDLLYELD